MTNRLQKQRNYHLTSVQEQKFKGRTEVNKVMFLQQYSDHLK